MSRILQFNFEDRDLVYLDRIHGGDIAKLARELHCDTIVVFARDAWGRAYYNSKVARKASRLGGRDFLRELVNEAKKLGLRVVVMIGHTTNPELYSRHPEWAQRDINGQVIHMDTNPLLEKNPPLRWPLMCLNSPFLDIVVEEAREVLEYGVDGVFLDSFRYMPDLERACYCQYCREKHIRELGRDMPRIEDFESRAYRETFKWRYMVNVRAIREINEVIKKINPRAILVYNSHPAGWKGRANTIVELTRDSLDVVFAEASEVDYQPPGFLAEIVKLTKALSGGKRVWTTRNVFHMALTTTSTTPIAIKQGIREIFAAGGDPMILVFSSTYMQSTRYKQVVKEVFEEVERLEEFMNGVERIRYVGVVYSNRSRDWAGRSDPRHITDDVRGFYYALTYNGLPVDFIVDSQLDSGDFMEFKGLLLGSTASISSLGVKYIEDFVERSSGLLATYISSLMNEHGDFLEEFQLADILRVSYRGLLKYQWSYISIDDREHPVTNSLLDRLVLWGDYDRVFRDRRNPPEISWHVHVDVRDRARILAHVVEPQSLFGYEYENGRSPPITGCDTKAPAIVVGEDYKTIYFTGQLGRLYWRLGLPEYEELILNSILWMAGKPPIRLNTPGLILMEPYKRSGQLIVHLVNLTFNKRVIVRGNTDDPLIWHSTAESIWPPGNIIPVEATLTLRGYEVKQAWSPITNRKYELEKTGGEIKINMKIGEYELIVLELN